MTRPTHDRRSIDGRSYLMRSIELGLAEFLASPAAGRPRGLDGSYMVDAHVGGWTNGDVIVAALGSAGIDARDPATFDAVRGAYDAPQVATFRDAWAHVARVHETVTVRQGKARPNGSRPLHNVTRTARDWRDLDLGTLADCHPAFASLALPGWVTDATIDDAAAAWNDGAPDDDEPPPIDDTGPDVRPTMEAPPMTATPPPGPPDDDAPFDEEPAHPAPLYVPRVVALPAGTLEAVRPTWGRVDSACFAAYVEDLISDAGLTPRERGARLTAWRALAKTAGIIRCACGLPRPGAASQCAAGCPEPDPATIGSRDGWTINGDGSPRGVVKGSMLWIWLMRWEARRLLDLPAGALTSDLTRARRRKADEAPIVPATVTGCEEGEADEAPRALPVPRKARPSWLRVVTDDDAPPAK